MFPQFDPSKMDPQVLMQLSQLIQTLPPDQLNRMQGLMHNAMAGFDVRTQMEEFERGLPPGFREKLMTLVASNPGAFAAPPSMQPPSQPLPAAGAVQGVGQSTGQGQPISQNDKMDMREARLVVLRGVAGGQVSPEEAEKLLFNS